MSGRNDIARLHARLAPYRHKVARSRQIVREWLTLCDHRACVAFSGGKDSSVILHLVRDECPDAVALHSDDEWLLPETEHLLQTTPGLVRLVRPLHHTSWFTAWSEEEGPNGGSKNRWAIENNYIGMAIGLRMEENARRKIHIRSRGHTFQTRTGLWQCYPIADWSWRDVWAYLVTENVPYNTAYDVLEQIGIAPARQRIGPLASERALGYGQLAILKRGWPSLYNDFAAKYPHARNDV